MAWIVVDKGRLDRARAAGRHDAVFRVYPGNDERTYTRASLVRIHGPSRLIHNEEHPRGEFTVWIETDSELTLVREERAEPP